MASFMLLFKDSIRLFASYNEGIINLLEKFFDMSSKKQCEQALNSYKKFLQQMENVGKFLKVAEVIFFILEFTEKIRDPSIAY